MKNNSHEPHILNVFYSFGITTMTMQISAHGPAPLLLPADTPPLTIEAVPTKPMNTGQDMYDKRSAEQILKNPLFSDMQRIIGNLWDSNSTMQAFYHQVGGDWTDTSMDPRKRADIAANAERVLQQIDKLEAHASQPYNYRLEGETPQDDRSRPWKENTTLADSEARRLLDFCDNGFSIFTSLPATQPNKSGRSTHNTGRDPGDHRTAEDIKKNPLFKKIISLHTGPDTKFNHLLSERREMNFFKQVGGNWNDMKLSDSHRADIAANAERVLEYIDSIGGKRSTANDHQISGIKSRRSQPDASVERLAIKDSEAWHVVNFADKGYRALP